MLTKLNLYIILLPFFSILVQSILFFLLQIINNKKYLLNLLISFFLISIGFLVNIYILNGKITHEQFFYLFFIFLCNSFIFMSLVQLPISSLQLTILRMINLNPGITKKRILKKYNPNVIFEERIKRLESTDVIYKKSSSYYLKDFKILLYLKVLNFLKKIFGIKN